MKNLSKKEAKEIARNTIQKALARVSYILEEYSGEQYSEEDKELINEYLDKDCERMLKLINRDYITF